MKFTLFTLISFIVFLIVIGPILTIWAWNTLFPSVFIPLDFETWFAVVILGGFFRATVKTGDKS